MLEQSLDCCNRSIRNSVPCKRLSGRATQQQELIVDPVGC